MPKWKGVSGCGVRSGTEGWTVVVEDWMAVAIRATSCIDGLKHGVGFERNGEKLQVLEYVYGTFLCVSYHKPWTFFRQSSVRNISFTVEMHATVHTQLPLPSAINPSTNQPVNQSKKPSYSKPRNHVTSTNTDHVSKREGRKRGKSEI